jgi:hypothetical protein
MKQCCHNLKLIGLGWQNIFKIFIDSFTNFYVPYKIVPNKLSKFPIKIMKKMVKYMIYIMNL